MFNNIVPSSRIKYSWAAVAVAAVSAAVKIGSGIAQKNKAKKLLKGLKEETIPEELLQNQKEARLAADQGLPSEQYGMAMRNIQRQQMTALRRANDMRGGLASISGIQQGTNDATLNLDSINAQARLANQRQLFGVNNIVANWKSQNARAKYNREWGYGMSLLGAGNQNVSSGIDTGIAGIGQGLNNYASGGTSIFGTNRRKNNRGGDAAGLG